MRSVGRDNLKVMFDTLHAIIETSQADYVEQCEEDLVHVNVSDSNRVIPGEGRVDWVGLMQALNECAYWGYLTMEIGLDSRAADRDQIVRTALRMEGSGITTEPWPVVENKRTAVFRTPTNFRYSLRRLWR